MSTKLAKCTYPDNSGPNDFKCFGPLATKDTEFSGTKLADMGCFAQEGVDSNKMYHACVCQHKTTGKWYVYVEYGRVGAKNPQFQFITCSSESEAQNVYENQCAEKNTKRGQWQVVGGIKLYRPRIGSNGKAKDLYVVRDLAQRDVGLPDARNITSPHFEATAPKTKSKSKKTHRCDPQTTKLMRDLLGGAITYTKANIQGGTIPTQRSIDQGRDLIQNVLKRISYVGNDIKAQIADKEIRDISYALYGLIPKVKPLHCPDEDWILSDYTTSQRRQSNIQIWQEDLDAFESALKSGSIDEVTHGDDPMQGIPADIEWIDPKSDLGQYLLDWWPKASLRRHGYGTMKILNLWKVNRHGDEAKFKNIQKNISVEMSSNWNNERPLHQDKKRYDLSIDERKIYWETNTALVFHGSRTVNLPGIIREHFRIPKDLVGVAITGAMFGAFGTYLADDWMKSAGYTSLTNSYWSRGGGGVAGRQAFMFACDTICGIPHVAPGPKGYTSPPRGHHSVFGKAKFSGVQNNEWVVVPKQTILKYLVEFKC